MTNEKEITADFAIEYLLDDCEDCPENKDGECMTQSHCFEVKQMAIKALEQEDILDKINAEIIKYEGDCRLSVDEYSSCKQCTDNVFETIYGIIDKYKAESEDKE